MFELHLSESLLPGTFKSRPIWAHWAHDLAFVKRSSTNGPGLIRRTLFNQRVVNLTPSQFTSGQSNFNTLLS